MRPGAGGVLGAVAMRASTWGAVRVELSAGTARWAWAGRRSKMARASTSPSFVRPSGRPWAASATAR